MHDIPFLRDFLVVIILALGVVCLLRRLRLPVIVGFLVAGALIGPGGLRLLQDRSSIEVMANVGAVLLLFTIGLKFSLAEIARLRVWVLGAGTLQVVLTSAVVAGCAMLLGTNGHSALFYGCLAALSSTAIVLRLLEDRGEAETRPGRFVLSVLILQDLALVPFMLLIPVLSATGSGPWWVPLTGLLKSLLIVVAIVLGARVIFPHLLHRAAATRSPEVFVLVILAVALGTAYLSDQAGLSLALGAFLAGVVIADTPYSHHVSAQILPLRDVFSSLFFVSIGMLVSPADWLARPLPLTEMTLGLLAVKGLVALVLALVFGLGLRGAIRCGGALAQVGELSLVLAQAGLTSGLLNRSEYETCLSVSVATMLLTPLAIPLSERCAQYLRRLYPAWQRSDKEQAEAEGEEPLDNHVVLVGYGINGRNVAQAITALGIRYVVIEMNPGTVNTLRDEQTRVLYGDACREQILRQAGLDRARVLIVAIADAAACRCITAVARGLCPSLRIIVRTRYTGEVALLRELGADQVVPEEFETSLELVALTLEAYGASSQEIARQRVLLRQEGYSLLREPRPRLAQGSSLQQLLTAADLLDVTLTAEAPAVGRSLAQIRLRDYTAASAVGLQRGAEVIANPPADIVFEPGDRIWLYGQRRDLERAATLLTGDPAPVADKANQQP